MNTSRFERPQLIRFAHCDPAGIVFFPQILVMFNGLVEDWVSEALGVPYAQLIGQRRTGMPTVSLETVFRAVSRIGDVVTLGLEVERLGTRSMTVALDVRCGDELRVSARQVLVTTSLDTHRAIEIPPDLRAAIVAFQGARA